MAHWKIGNGFAIRYGGYRDIQWFKGEEFEQIASKFSTTFPPLHPAGLVIEAAKTVALFLQYWEMRKQTLLQGAQFEERRLIWLTDLLSHWYTEVQQGMLALDTIYYLDREVSRLLNKIRANSLIDAPSALLLHVERSANLLVKINSTINALMMERSPNFTLPGTDIPSPFYYRPYYELTANTARFDQYIESANKVVDADISWLGSLFQAGTMNMVIGTSPTIPLIVGSVSLLWTASKLLSARSQIKNAERVQDFMAFQSFCIEVRSTNSLLRLAQRLPAYVKVYDIEALESGSAGEVLMLEEPKSS